MKVSSTFSKVVESKGEPSPGVPPFFLWVCTCAPIRWEVVDGLSCDSTPFLWCLPKETVSSRQRKALFLPRCLHHSRERYKSVDYTFLARLGGGGWYVCAVFLGRSLFPLLPVPPHFFALAQRNGVEPQRNALLGAATGAVRSHPPLPRTRSPNITADCVKLTLPGQFTHRVQINLTHQFVPLGLTPKWERRVGPPR